MNKVVSYHDQPYGEYQQGYCKVETGNKCGFILKVVKSRAGQLFCAFSSVKVGEDWLPSFSFLDKDYERKFLTECMAQVEKLIDAKKPAPQPQPQQDFVPAPTQDLPF